MIITSTEGVYQPETPENPLQEDLDHLENALRRLQKHARSSLQISSPEQDRDELEAYRNFFAVLFQGR